MTEKRGIHGGNLIKMAELADCRVDEILDFSANINPMGFPEWLRPLINSQISSLVHYPDPTYSALKTQMSHRYNVPIEDIILGNGSSEILYALPIALKLNQIILPVPSYSDYEAVARLFGLPIQILQLKEQDGFALDWTRLDQLLSEHEASSRIGVFLGNPNNPTGLTLNASALREVAGRHPNSTFIVDEAFMDFTNGLASLQKDRPKNILILHSMTKILAIPGLRIGYALADQEIAAAIRAQIPSWSVNALAAAVMDRALIDDEEFFEQSRRHVAKWREELELGLATLSWIHVFPGEANYLLLRIKNEHLTSGQVCDQLLKRYRIGVRDCESYLGLDHRFLRIAVRRPEENKRLLDALSELSPLGEGVSRNTLRNFKKPRRTPSLMLQGTGSNVGKSILTTALCRILYQDGVQVAPFKSQNMALNSFVTPSGGEIGRAQALQAQACKLIPDVRMNPVLLKPSNESGSQVILSGKPVAHMDFRDYSRFKATAFEEVKRAYDSLAAENDIVLIEGAGSASEVNLKKNDIVNMRMAQHAEARVLLVGNIDQGGIFGAFVGTMETLAEWERDLVAGFVINRFRGIKDLLADGLTYIHGATGKPVVGVVPYLPHLLLPEEDSLEFKSGTLNDLSLLGNRIDIALIDTPRISNFTDVDALRIEDDVRVRHVRVVEELGNPDVIILAGSKNVVSDLKHLMSCGLTAQILEIVKSGRCEIVGICGGYQMLGERLLDPHHLETEHDVFLGLGLLPLETCFETEKVLAQTKGYHLDSKLPVHGYEIHHGQTRALGALKVSFEGNDGLSLGHQNSKGNVWGTYLHGVFDDDGFRRWFIDKIRERKGMQKLGSVRAHYTFEKSLDRLAATVRESLDMRQIYQWLGL